MDLPAAVSCSVSKQENRRDQRTDHAPRQALRRPPQSASRGAARGPDRRVDPLVPAERSRPEFLAELTRRRVDVFVVDEEDLARELRGG